MLALAILGQATADETPQRRADVRAAVLSRSSSTSSPRSSTPFARNTITFGVLGTLALDLGRARCLRRRDHRRQLCVGRREDAQLLEAQAVFVRHAAASPADCCSRRVVLVSATQVVESPSFAGVIAALSRPLDPARARDPERHHGALHPDRRAGVLLRPECEGAVPGRVDRGVPDRAALEGRAGRVLLVHARHDAGSPA